MGKKYRELKKTLLENPERRLVIVDDRKIREKEFASIDKILKKMDSLENRIRDFNDKDQRLYQDWYNLTFRSEIEKIEDRKAKMTMLFKLHNSIVAYADMHKVNMIRAYQAIKDEEIRWANGDPTTRAKIEKLKAERDEFIRRKFEEDFSSDDDESLWREFENESDDTDLNDQDLSRQARADDKGWPSGNKSGETVSKEERQKFQKLAKMTDQQLKFLLQGNKEMALMFLAELVGLGILMDDVTLIRRIWGLTPGHLKKTFNQMAREGSGNTMEELLEAYENYDNLKEDFDREFGEDEGKDDGSDVEDENLGHGFRSSRQGRSEVNLSPLENERLKGLYHRLVRQLHPDLNSMQSGSWMMEMWHKVQGSFRKKSISDLENIDLILALRKRELNRFTLSEIKGAESMLVKQLEGIESQTKKVKRSPAWGFSHRKDFGPLIRKAKVSLSGELSYIGEQMSEIEQAHKYFERRSNEQTLKATRKQANQTKSKAQRAGAKKRASDPRQWSLF